MNIIKFKDKIKSQDFFFQNKLHRFHLEANDRAIFVCYTIKHDEDTRATVIREPVKLNWLEKGLGVNIESKTKATIKKVKSFYAKLEKNRLLAMDLQSRLELERA